MGGELGGPGGKAPRFRPQRSRVGPGGLPPGLGHGVQGGSGGACPRFRPQRLELTHFVTGSVIFLWFFMHFATYIPHPKPPFSQQVPLACWWLSGVFPHILLILEHKIGCFVVVSMVFSCKSRCVCIVYIYLLFCCQ